MSNADSSDHAPGTVTLDDIREKICIIRGRQVMLDFDLAEVYGYTTSAFNQQVQRNIDKFDEDFRFQLTRLELDELVKSQIVISRNPGLFQGQSGGSRKLPYAFTEQGIYMLMTVLRGELATRQSKALIRLFKQMKDCLLDTRMLPGFSGALSLAAQTSANTRNIIEIGSRVAETQDTLARSMTGSSCWTTGWKPKGSSFAVHRRKTPAKERRS